MSEILTYTFCDLFGFNSKRNPISRLPLKIGKKVYPTDFEFKHGLKYANISICDHINDLAVVSFENDNFITLYMFNAYHKLEKTPLINSKPEQALYKYGKSKYIKKAYEEGKFRINPALEFIRDEHNSAIQDNENLHKKKVKGEVVNITKGNKVINPSGDIILSELELSVDSFIL